MSAWNQVNDDLTAAAGHAPVGATLPAMAGRSGFTRLIGRAFARVVYGSAKPLTSRQRAFNERLLSATVRTATAAAGTESEAARLARELAAAVNAIRALTAKYEVLEAKAETAGKGVAWLTDEAWRMRRFVEPFHTRPGTNDAEVRDEVVWGREYRLPEAFTSADVMIDIGGHVGSFTFACLVRGALAVSWYEVDPRNFDIATTNLARFGGRADLNLRAAWRSDGTHGDLRFNCSSDPLNIGGGGVHSTEGGAPIAWVALDDIITDLLARTGRPRVRLLKIDCEGSEFPILFTATKLHLVDEICGEYHEIPDATPIPDHYKVAGWDKFNRRTLKQFLTQQGYAVELVEGPDTLGLFFAKRK